MSKSSLPVLLTPCWNNLFSSYPCLTSSCPPSECFFLQPSTAEGVLSLGPHTPQGRPEGGVSFLLANTAFFKPFLAPSHTKNKTNKKNLKTEPSEAYVLSLYHLLRLSSLSYTDFLSFSVLAYFLMTSTSMWMDHQTLWPLSSLASSPTMTFSLFYLSLPLPWSYLRELDSQTQKPIG